VSVENRIWAIDATDVGELIVINNGSGTPAKPNRP